MKIFQLRFVFTIAVCLALLFSACSERDIEKFDSVNMESSVSEEISSISDEEYAELLKQANIITQQLITYSFNDEAVNGIDKPSKLAINSFILTVPVVKEDGYMYKDFVMEKKSDEYSVYKYPEKNEQQIAYEVFGVDNWVLEGGNTVFYEDQGYYESKLEFGIGGFLSCEYVVSTLSDDKLTIQTKFLLTDFIGSKGEPGWKEHGGYTVEFQIMSENGRKFLRFIELKRPPGVRLADLDKTKLLITDEFLALDIVKDYLELKGYEQVPNGSGGYTYRKDNYELGGNGSWRMKPNDEPFFLISHILWDEGYLLQNVYKPALEIRYAVMMETGQVKVVEIGNYE